MANLVKLNKKHLEHIYKNFQATYKKFPGLTTINASKGPPIPYMAAKFRLKNKKTGETRDVIKVTSELKASWK